MAQQIFLPKDDSMSFEKKTTESKEKMIKMFSFPFEYIHVIYVRDYKRWRHEINEHKNRIKRQDETTKRWTLEFHWTKRSKFWNSLKCLPEMSVNFLEKLNWKREWIVSLIENESDRSVSMHSCIHFVSFCLLFIFFFWMKNDQKTDSDHSIIRLMKYTFIPSLSLFALFFFAHFLFPHVFSSFLSRPD